MKPFLDTVADAYARRHPDPSALLFLFPNKRSGTFFLKSFRDCCRGRDVLLPETSTLSAFAERACNLVVPPRIELLMRLYNSYRSLHGDYDFNRFVGWGETVLNDFDEVDINGVDAAQLFKNIEDFRDIQSTFLTPDQLEVMRECFGYDPGKYDPSNFWMRYNYHSDRGQGRHTGIKDSFGTLWNSLHELYLRFNDDLEADDLAYRGRVYRRLLEMLEQDEPLPGGYEKVVFVGFNMLSRMEHGIFTRFRKMRNSRGEPLADFVWDYAGAAMKDERNSAMRFMRNNIKTFPKPEWLDLSPCDTDEMPVRMKIYSSPSNVAQTKIVTEILDDLSSRVSPEEFAAAKVAVTLPDESLLLPMLYSLPKGISEVNLTMGYPMRYTSTLSLVNLLHRLQRSKRRTSGGGYDWYYRDLQLLLSHPLMHAWIGTEAVEAANRAMAEQRRFRIEPQFIGKYAPEAFGLVLAPLTEQTTLAEAYGWLTAVLDGVDAALRRTQGDKAMVKRSLDAAHLHSFRDILSAIYEAFLSQEIEADYHTLFNTSTRLAAAEKVSFVGEPIQGLQIMGVLETRSLDFDYLIIPSMNERIFPRRFRRHSFIPATMRHAYGLPAVDAVEAEYAYHFYSMISRAKEVFFTYDARTAGVKSGDMSRYLLQLRHLYAPADRMEVIPRSFRIAARPTPPLTIEKDDEIMARLEEYLKPGGKKNFSASTLTDYLTCPVKFYMKKVVQIPEVLEASETLDPVSEGNVVHDVMMEIYLGDPSLAETYLVSPVAVTAQKIKSLLAQPDRITERVRRGIRKHYLNIKEENGAPRPLDRDLEMAVPIITEQILNILKRDLDYAPLYIRGCEFSDSFRYPLSDGRQVNMTYKIDRMDVTADGSERILDYKTGKSHLTADSVNEVFAGVYSAKHIFQLQLYAELFAERHPGAGPFQLEIYSSPYLAPNRKKTEPHFFFPTIGGQKVENHSQISGEFRQYLDTTLLEILNPSIPFTATADPMRCTLCQFASLCQR